MKPTEMTLEAVRNYYGRVLKGTQDLQTSACLYGGRKEEAAPRTSWKWKKKKLIHDEVKDKILRLRGRLQGHLGGLHRPNVARKKTGYDAVTDGSASSHQQKSSKQRREPHPAAASVNHAARIAGDGFSNSPCRSRRQFRRCRPSPHASSTPAAQSVIAAITKKRRRQAG